MLTEPTIDPTPISLFTPPVPAASEIVVPGRPLNLSAAAGKPQRRRSYTIPLLLLLTLVAGCLRFLSLDRPTIWGDEAATYGRSVGTYQDLLEQLYSGSFPPLHYEALWWLGQGMPYWGHVVQRDGQSADAKAQTSSQLSTFIPTKFLVPGGIPLTPFFMRLIPAVCGTLFIPAIFFLTRQLFGPRVSLLTAFLACFSAYLLVYSRDGKMYMPFWLMCVLNVGCLLWWLRVRRPLPWLLWVASGIAMIGWHASGFTMLAIDALIFFTTPKLHWRKIPSLVGYLLWPVAAVFALSWELTRRRFFRDAAWNPWDRLITWPRRTWQHFAWPAVVFYALGMTVILSSMFGPTGFYSGFDGVYNRAAKVTQPSFDTGMFGIDWVGRYNAGRQLPDYLLYTSSAYLTGWEWPRHFPRIGMDDQANVAPRTLRLLQASTIALLCLLAAGLVPWRRAFSPARARLDRIRQERSIAPPYRRRRVFWVAVWLTAVPWVTYTQSTLRPATILDGVAGIVLNEAPAVRWPRARVISLPEAVPAKELGAWDSFKQAFSARWAITKQSWAEIKIEWPTAWSSYKAGYHAGNYSAVGITIVIVIAATLLTLTIWKWRSIGRGSFELSAVVVVLVVIGTPLVLLPRWVDDDLWMPRYIGVIVPAFLIVVAALIARQPTRWLPAVTMGLFVIVNLTQFGARVFGHSEPPTDLMAADLIAAQPKSVIPRMADVPTFRAYTDLPTPIAEPGGSTLFNPAGRYYLHLLSGFKDRGREVKDGEFESELSVWRFSAPAAIERDLKRSPQISSFVVWTTLPPGEIDQTDPIDDTLTGQFRRVSDQIWPVADHWRWVQHAQFRRRAYERAANPTTQPAHPG